MGKALVTGAANGIGKATVDLLVEHGHTVSTVDIDEKGLGTLPSQVETYWADVTDREKIASIAEGLDVDVVVNNAGYQGLGAVEDMDLAAVRNHFETNVYGMWNVTQAVLPQLRENNGRVINISSMAGDVTAPFWAAYTATKQAVNGFSEALRMEVAPFNVDVVTVAPGPIRTGFNERGRSKLEQYLPDSVYTDGYRTYLGKSLGGVSAERAAQVIVHAAETRFPQHLYTVTWQAWLAPKLKALLPTKLWEWMVRRTQTG